MQILAALHVYKCLAGSVMQAAMQQQQQQQQQQQRKVFIKKRKHERKIELVSVLIAIW